MACNYSSIITMTSQWARWRLKSAASWLFTKRRSKKTSKLRVTGLCEGNSQVICEFPAQGPVTRKIFPFDDVIMVLKSSAVQLTTFDVRTSMSNNIPLFYIDAITYPCPILCWFSSFLLVNGPLELRLLCIKPPITDRHSILTAEPCRP